MRPAGFLATNKLSDVPGFTAQSGQGVPGADLQCNQTLIPGKCALSNTYDAIIVCVRTPDCQAVVHYFNGTDGCSDPVTLLVHNGLSQTTSFMSPKVATLSRLDFSELVRDARAAGAQWGAVGRARRGQACVGSWALEAGAA